MQQLPDQQREHLLQAAAQFGAAVNEFITAVLPAVQAMAEQFAQLGQQLTAAGYLNADGKPIRPSDRPAWQSPYGPKPGAHRR